MKTLSYIAVAALLITVGVIGCDNGVAPSVTQNDPDQEFALLKAEDLIPASEAAPTPLVQVGVGAETLEFWPYTGVDFTGSPQDPVNLIFYGEADPRDIRAALMSLDGNRNIPGLPPVPPFSSTWTDAIGDVQSGFGMLNGWTGSVVQLACGAYDQPRFHIRLFQVGDWTVANAHFEVMIPGTADHQVLSWELAEQFIVADFMRTGLLDQTVPLIPTDQINDVPFRTIPAMLYNELPVELRMLIEGPLEDVTEDVPINTDGHAMILNLADRSDYAPGSTHESLTLTYGQVIPKPFCASGPADYVWVSGPVELEQSVTLTPGGTFTMSFQAKGKLDVTPVNPMTGEPIGETMTAHVRQQHQSMMNNSHFSATGTIYQRLGHPNEEAGGLLFTRLRVADDGHCGFNATIECNSDDETPPPLPRVAGAGLVSDRLK